MARTTFTGPVRSLNGFEGVFSSTSIELQSNNANKITLDAPNGLAASYSFILPPNDGTANQVLATDGNGVTTWVNSNASLALVADTAANLALIGNAINTTGKYTGKMVVDLATGLIFTATGSAASAVWRASDGTTVATPI